jgi:S1-C subfamily serine protease
VVLSLAFVSYQIQRSVSVPLTLSEVDKEVAQGLDQAAAAPSFQSTAFRHIQPALVTIQVAYTRADGTNGERLGTGVVIDTNGKIMTCLHIVDQAKAIAVTFSDGTESSAQVSAKVAKSDIALLAPQTIPDNLTPAVLGSSGSLRVGDEVMAVGNPFGSPDSLTSGVVSGLGRSYADPDTGVSFNNLIQFDAAVNPGCSGGPLIDRRGEVVGIVAALLNPTGQGVFIGIGFAVPISSASSAMGAPWY